MSLEDDNTAHSSVLGGDCFQSTDGLSWTQFYCGYATHIFDWLHGSVNLEVSMCSFLVERQLAPLTLLSIKPGLTM